jgi:hypothetical protein
VTRMTVRDRKEPRAPFPDGTKMARSTTPARLLAKLQAGDPPGSRATGGRREAMRAGASTLEAGRGGRGSVPPARPVPWIGDLILIRVLPGACFPWIASVAWENDVPLETVRDRCEPLGSDGMWTKRGPGPSLGRLPVPSGGGRHRRSGPPRRATGSVRYGKVDLGWKSVPGVPSGPAGNAERPRCAGVAQGRTIDRGIVLPLR